MLNSTESVIDKLKSSGHRITKARNLTVELLTKATVPLAALDILQALEKMSVKVNKTTVYRELDFLIAQEIIKEVDFGDGKKRYETRDDSSHHHHIICINCKKVEDVDLKLDLHQEEKDIQKSKNFKVLSHSLEFFGLCSDCR